LRFSYKTVSQNGREAAGYVDAESYSDAEKLLWQADLTITHLKEIKRPLSLQEAVPTLFGIRRKDIIYFSGDLATLLASGISILASLKMLMNQTRKLAMQKVISTIVKDLETGSSFFEACSAHPKVFPQFYLRLIKVAEEAGNLELILRQLTGYMEKEETVKDKVRSALAYPVFVIIVALVAVTLMLTLVMPAMQKLFKEFGGQLPLTTRVLIALSGFIRGHALEMLIAVFLLVVFLMFYLKRPSGARIKDRVLLKVPLIKDIILKSNLSRMARTSAILLRSGVPLIETLELSTETQGNVVLKDALSAVKTEVLKGASISGAMTPFKVFPNLFFQMIAIGEESGRLEGNLESVAETYERESDRTVTKLLGMLEPAMVVAVGGFVAFIAISVVSPLYKLLQEIK